MQPRLRVVGSVAGILNGTYCYACGAGCPEMYLTRKGDCCSDMTAFEQANHR